MAIKITAEGRKSIVDITGKVDNSFFPKSWCVVRLGIDKSTTLLFNLYAKHIRCALNKAATEKAGCDIYGVVYIIHPDMVSTRIRQVTVNEMNNLPEEPEEEEQIEAPKEVEEPQEVKASEPKKAEPKHQKEPKTDIITGEEAIRLIKSIQGCSVEALGILSQYCKFSTLQVDVKALIEAEKRNR